jgi:adenine-specific DNA-methyltransferase
LYTAVCLASAKVTSVGQADLAAFGGYEKAIQKLNSIPARDGFIFREYSPASKGRCGIERKYFTEANAARIDAIRTTIAEWSVAPGLSGFGERLLIADLLQAANRVANIAGTYGCFLRNWSNQALEPLRLRPRAIPSFDLAVDVSVGDAFTLATAPGDTVYIDPPYTKRQYAAYYHVLETIAYGDEPQVEGITGLRPWRSKSSPFCYKRRALSAFGNLLVSLKSERALISYSSAGHIGIDELTSFLGSYGDLTVYHLDSIPRYRPNEVARQTRDDVDEYLFELLVSRPAARAAGVLA